MRVLKRSLPYPPHKSTGSNEPQKSMFSPFKNFYHPSILSMVPCQNNSASTLVSLIPRGDFNPRISFELPSTLSFQILTLAGNSRILRNPAHTPCDFHNKLWLYKHSNSAHSLRQKFFNLLLGLEEFKTIFSLHTPCMALCYTRTSMGISNDISPKLSEINSKPCQRTPCGLSLHFLQEFSGRETIETHTLLTNFIHST
jgi:hypothetical protein